MQSSPAQTEVFNDVEDLLRLLHTTQLRLQMITRGNMKENERNQLLKLVSSVHSIFILYIYQAEKQE